MKRNLTFISGQGYSYSSEQGRFEVKADGKRREFSSLSKARAFYESIQEEKSIWDITKIPELLECHAWRQP